MSNIPAYMNIRQYVVDMVMEHRDADRPIMSERELSRKFNVSRTTVRNALADLVADNWLYTKSGRGMFLNTRKERNNLYSLRHTCKVLVLTGDGKMTFLDGFHMKLLSAVLNLLGDLPVRLRLVNLSSGNGQAAEELGIHNADGIIWFSPCREIADVVTAVRETMPVFTVGCVPDGHPYNVTADYYRAGRMAAAWFLDRGRRKVLFAGHQQEVSIKQEIYRGWNDEYRGRGLEGDSELTIDMDDDMVQKTGALLKQPGLIEGIFSLSSAVAAIEIAWADSGMPRRSDSCPVMIDWSEPQLPELGFTPAARLVILPPRAAEIAAEALYARLNDPQYVAHETVLEPNIE